MDKMRRHLKGKCFERAEGYWTYEVCPFSTVRQFHRPPGSHQAAARDPLFSLGTHVTKRNAVFRTAAFEAAAAASHGGVAPPPAPAAVTGATVFTDAMMYVPAAHSGEAATAPELMQAHRTHRDVASAAQHFEGGSNNRQTTVYFRCVQNVQNAQPASSSAAPAATAIATINEPRPFHYIVMIETPHACVPPSAAAQAATERAAAEEVAAKKKKEEEIKRTAGASYFLKSLELNAPQFASAGGAVATAGSGLHYCAQLLAGWWTYEFCLHRHVRQFHQEAVVPASGAPAPPADAAAAAAAAAAAGTPPTPPAPKPAPQMHVTVEYSLGTLTPPTDRDGRLVVPPLNKYERGLGGLAGGLKLNALPADQHLRAREHRPYISWNYTGGTPCDIEAARTPRQTEVRLYCDESRAPQPLRVESVDEVASCRYVLKAHTSALCAMPAMALPPPTVREIACVPVPAFAKAE